MECGICKSSSCAEMWMNSIHSTTTAPMPFTCTRSSQDVSDSKAVLTSVFGDALATVLGRIEFYGRGCCSHLFQLPTALDHHAWRIRTVMMTMFPLKPGLLPTLPQSSQRPSEVLLGSQIMTPDINLPILSWHLDIICRCATCLKPRWLAQWRV